MKELKYTQVKANGGTQMRDGVNTDTVAEYADAMRHNKSYQPFPPLIVYFDGSEYWLADGFHRLAAAFQAFGSGCTVPADIRAGTRRDAILHAAGANADHGLQRTNADKRRAVEALLRDEEWGQWSDREIARRCNVSNHLVADMRRTVHTGNSPSMDSRTFVHHKTGQPATMNTAGIGKPTPPPATPTPPRREYESAVPLITPPATVLDRSLSAMDQEVAAIIEPEPRRAATPAIIAEPDPEPEAEPEAEAEDSDEYYTPLYIIKAARQVLGKIDLDPASCKVAQRVVLATVYLNKANDSLRPKIPWLGRVWLNPPFSNPAPFTTKLIEEYEAGRTKAAILLVNNGTETKWGQALLRRYPVCFVGAHDGYGSRISFWKNDPDEPRTGNRYAQMIFYMGQTPDTFAEVFSQFGVIKT